MHSSGQTAQNASEKDSGELVRERGEVKGLAEAAAAERGRAREHDGAATTTTPGIRSMYRGPTSTGSFSVGGGSSPRPREGRAVDCAIGKNVSKGL